MAKTYELHCCDFEFGQAAMGFGREGIAYSPGQKIDKDLKWARDFLIDYLRSDKPLGEGERQELAWMLEGQWKVNRGNPKKLRGLRFANAEYHIREEQKRLKSIGIKKSLPEIVGEFEEELGNRKTKVLWIAQLNEISWFCDLDPTEKAEELIAYINKPSNRKY